MQAKSSKLGNQKKAKIYKGMFCHKHKDKQRQQKTQKIAMK